MNESEIVSPNTAEARAYARRQVAVARERAYSYIGRLDGADDETVAHEAIRFGGKASQWGHMIISFTENV